MLTVSSFIFDNKYKQINYPNFKSIPATSGISYSDLKLPNDSVTISFTSNDSSINLNIEQAKELGGIHCPICGAKMLTKEEFDRLLKTAETIETPSDFVKVLKVYKDYVPSNMKKILVDIDNPEACTEDSMLNYYYKLRSISNERFRKRLFYASSTLKGFSEFMPDDIKEEAMTIAEKFPKVKSYKEFKELFDSLYKNPNLTQADKNKLTRYVLHDVKSSAIFYKVFAFPADEMSTKDIAINLIDRIFSKSLIESSNIQTNEYFGDLSNNSVLLCARCHQNSPSYSFLDFKNLKLNSFPYIKDNFNAYLSDLASLMGKGLLDDNPSYFNDFCFYVDKLSGSKIVFDKVALNRLRNLRYLSTRRESFAPAEQTEVDIPCAGCGSIMLPHDNRRIIRHDLQNARNPKEYLDVLNKYNKYVGEYSKDLYKIFKNIIEKNPTISVEEFVPLFQAKVNKMSDIKVDYALLEFEKNKNYFMENGTDFQKEILTKFNRQLYDALEKGNFSDFVFIDLFESITDGIDLNAYKMPKAVYVLLDDLRKIAFINSLSKYSELDQKCDKDPVETIVFNMFKTDVFTVDHLVSMAKGGSRTKDNLIGLCKYCNTLKSEKGVRAWYVENFDVRRNFHKQLLVVDDMAKKGLLEGYDSWASDIAQKMYELTYGKYDIRHKIKKD